jgi:photosystem II stability/assembly factor-like uncharacterized protein
MKKYIIIVFFIIINLCYAQEKWYWQNPRPQGNDLNDVYFINDSVGWAVGNNSAILKTINGGATWTNQYAPRWHNLQSVHFINEKTGWSVGDDKFIIKTTDGGKSWNDSEINSDLYSFKPSCVYFLNDSVGWEGSGYYYSGGTVYILLHSTKDGGKTWKTVMIDMNSYSPYSGFMKIDDLIFTDDMNGFGVGTGGTTCFFIRTNDGGQHWEYKAWYDIATFIRKTISVIDSDHIYLSASNDHYWFTEDGGKNWIEHTTLDKYDINGKNRFFKFHFTDTLNGIATYGLSYGDNNDATFHDYYEINGQTYRTNDGGNTWTKLEKNGQPYMNNMFIFKSNKICGVGPNGNIYISLDSGKNWSTYNNDIRNHNHDIFFIDTLNGWACGDNGVIFSTINGGKDWILHNKPTLNNLNSIFFTDTLNGWAVGSGGTVLFTSDRGSTWYQHDTIINNDFRKIYFIDRNNGWLLSYYNLYRTTNAGVDWQNLGLPLNHVNDFYFKNLDEGWVVGYGNVILHTTNGGISWIVQRNINEKAELYSIDFHDNIGCCVGYSIEVNHGPNDPPDFSGSYFKTTDGGQNWINLNPYQPYVFNQFSKIKYINDIVGWLRIYWNIYIEQSLDTLKTWHGLDTRTQYKINNIFYKDSDHGWFVGNNGAILHTQDLYAIKPLLDSNITPQISDSTLIIYPIPFDDYLIINNQDNNPITSLKIFNMLGEMVYENSTYLNNQIIIPTNMYEPGLYFCFIKSGNDISIKKIVKVRLN